MAAELGALVQLAEKGRALLESLRSLRHGVLGNSVVAEAQAHEIANQFTMRTPAGLHTRTSKRIKGSWSEKVHPLWEPSRGEALCA